MEFFADTALECKKLNNFNSFMAISGELPATIKWEGPLLIGGRGTVFVHAVVVIV